jgi:1-phosphofructokinase family hexose kinase
MILVVTPNLAVDVTLPVEALRPGKVHRTDRSRRQAGGKGVNFARALRSLGAQGAPDHPPLVLGFAGGRAGEAIREGLARENLAAELVPFPGESRTCTIILDENGVATVVNEAGPSIEDPRELLSRFGAVLDRARAVAFMGSLPPGVRSDLYAEMIALSRKKGLLSLVDTSGEALKEGLSAGPTFAKPNRAEAEELLGVDLSTDDARREAVAEIRRRGAEAAFITFGAEGFLLACDQGTFRSHLPPGGKGDLRLGNPTGAGDTFAAGLLAGAVRGYPVSDSARLAAAAAAASLAEGYGRFRARDLRVEAFRLEAV